MVGEGNLGGFVMVFFSFWEGNLGGRAMAMGLYVQGGFRLLMKNAVQVFEQLLIAPWNAHSSSSVSNDISTVQCLPLANFISSG